MSTIWAHGHCQDFFSLMGTFCVLNVAISSRMPVRTCKQVVFLCDAVHLCLVFLQRWCPSRCHLMTTLLAMCARWEACCLVHGAVVLMCTRVAVIPTSCRDPDQLCFFCVDMDYNEAALDGGNCVLWRMLDFGQFDFGQFDFGQLAEVEIGRSRNWPKSIALVLCTLDQDENNSLILPCCRNRIHVGCSAQSVQQCGTPMPMERDGTFSAHGLSVDVNAAVSYLSPVLLRPSPLGPKGFPGLLTWAKPT